MLTSQPEAIVNKREAERVIRALLDDAERHIDKVALPFHARNWSVYHGRVHVKPDPGGASMVATVAKDTTNSIVTDVLDLLASSDRICEYIPASQQLDEAQLTDSATRGAHALFWASGGYQATQDALHDGAVSGVSGGWFRVGIKQQRKRKPIAQPSLWTENDFIAAQQQKENDPNFAVKDHGNGVFSSSTIQIKQKIEIEAVPSSDMIWTVASCADEAELIGRRCDTRLGKLVEIGFDPADLVDIDIDQRSKARNARRARDRKDVEAEPISGAWSLKPVTFFELYVRIDVDGDGLPELYQVYMAGKSRKLLHMQEVDYQPFCQLSWSRIPHGMYAEGIVERCISGQDASTKLLWAALDNADLQSSPMIMAPDNAVDHDAMAVWKKYKVVRNDAPGSVEFFQPSDASGAIFASKQLIEEEVENRIGVSKVSQSLDPNSLASVPEASVLGAMAANQRKVMFFARTLAEFGFKTAFQKLLFLMVRNPDLVRAAKIPSLSTFQPDGYDPDWQVRVKVGLGNADAMSHERIYQQMFQLAQTFAAAPAPLNKASSPAQIMTMLRDYLRCRPDIQPDRYFATPEQMTQWMQEAQQQPPPPDPKIQVAQMQIQADQQKTQMQIDAQRQIEAAKLAENKRQHDTKLGTESVFAAQKIALEAAALRQDRRRHHIDTAANLVRQASSTNSTLTNGNIAERGD